MYSDCRLLLFTRYPEAGKTKTRMIPAVGADGAALLQRRLTERIVAQARLLADQTGIETVVHYSGGNRVKMTSWLGPLAYARQASGDLGCRMRTALQCTFEAGVERAVLIGSDIPDLTAELLHRAFSLLQSGEVVIGPSRDGGYYLIGLAGRRAPQLLPVLFHDMPWSSDTLFATTVQRLERAGQAVAILPALSDIDLPADLPYARTRGLL